MVYIPKTNKIIQYGLEQEVLELRDSGLSQDDIAAQIKYRHQDIADLRDLSPMSINRFLKGVEVDKLVLKDKKNEAPEDALRTEFREKMYILEEDTLDIYKIMRKSLKGIVASGDNEKIIKSAKDVLFSIEQSRRNWSTLVDQAYRQFGMLAEAKQTNYIQVNNLLVDYSKDLCPACRKVVVDKILEYEKKNNLGGNVDYADS